MKTPERKFLSEHALNIFSSKHYYFPAGELFSEKEMDVETLEYTSDCHVYLICRKPACAINSTNFKYEEGILSGEVNYRIDGKKSVIPFSYEFPMLDGAKSVRVSPYPHREFQTVDSSGETVRVVPASALGMRFSAEMRKLEVLYVGQAYAGGRRSAMDRLKSHSTLQKILANMLSDTPDDEAVICAFNYSSSQIIAYMDGTAKKAISGEEDQRRFRNILDNPLTEHQKICLAEAGLIRYFKPKYNEIYKESFPATDQRLLYECLELDFAALIIEIDTQEIGMQLHSSNAASEYHHTAKFDLIDPQVRRSFFTFVDSKGNSSTMKNVTSPSNL